MHGRQPPPPPAKRTSLKRPRRETPPALSVPDPRWMLPDVPPRSLREGIALTEALLDRAGVADSVADARLVLAKACGASPTWVLAHELEAIPDSAWPLHRILVARRCAREPVQHILGRQEFFSLDLEVTPDVLIPRPETELLVEAAIAEVREMPFSRMADIGTGSGAIAIALVIEAPGSRVVASDISRAALDVARDRKSVV